MLPWSQLKQRLLWLCRPGVTGPVACVHLNACGDVSVFLRLHIRLSSHVSSLSPYGLSNRIDGDLPACMVDKQLLPCYLG